MTVKRKPADNSKGDGIAGRTGPRVPYDPAFADAVAAGLLTPRQALERGRRESYALNLAKRYGVSPKRAHDVADNRISLREALAAAPPPADVPPPAVAAPSTVKGSRPAPISGAFLAGTVAVVLMLGAAGWVFTTREGFVDRRDQAQEIRERGRLALEQAAAEPAALAPEAPPARPAMHAEAPGGAGVARDAEGQVVRIEAGTPTAVIRTYCATALACDLKHPVELAPPVPASGAARIGLFTDGVERRPWGVWIQKDRKSGRWVAGDGKLPIQRVPAVELSVGKPRVAVDLKS